MPSAVTVLHVRQNVGREKLPNGILWSVQYWSPDGRWVYAVDYDQAKADIPATRFANTGALFGMIRGTKMLVEVQEVDGIHYAVSVARDEDAEYPECPRCAFMDELRVTTAEQYLEELCRFDELEAEGHWEIKRHDVPREELFYNSERALLRVRCLDCRGEYACGTAGEREASGIHYSKVRHSFVDLGDD